MPRHKANPDPLAGRRDRLSLAKLASYDDVATDAMVDNVRILTTASSLNAIYLQC